MKRTNCQTAVSRPSCYTHSISTSQNCEVNPPKNSAPPLITPVREIDEKLIVDAEEQMSVESQVIVHCTVQIGIFGGRIRIWPSTYLFDLDSDHRSALVHAEGVSMYPTWTDLWPFQSIEFTLIFEGLPKTCVSFDLKEVIPQAGGMHIKGIPRNTTDVYKVVC